MSFQHIIRRGSQYLNLRHMVRSQVVHQQGKGWKAIMYMNSSPKYVSWRFKNQNEAHRFVQEAIEEAKTGQVYRKYLEEIKHLI